MLLLRRINSKFPTGILPWGVGLLVLSDQSLDGLDRNAIEAWLEDIVPQVCAKYPKWADDVKRNGVEAVCRDIETFSRKYKLSDLNGFWRILEKRLRQPQLFEHLTEFQKFILSRTNASEKLRLDRYFEDLEKGSTTVLLKIRLDQSSSS